MTSWNPHNNLVKWIFLLVPFYEQGNWCSGRFSAPLPSDRSRIWARVLLQSSTSCANDFCPHRRTAGPHLQVQHRPHAQDQLCPGWGFVRSWGGGSDDSVASLSHFQLGPWVPALRRRFPWAPYLNGLDSNPALLTSKWPWPSLSFFNIQFPHCWWDDSSLHRSAERIKWNNTCKALRIGSDTHYSWKVTWYPPPSFTEI